MAQFTVPLPRFDGRGSFRRFRDDFTSFCKIQNFTDDAAMNCLPLSLSAVAREAFDGIERPNPCTTALLLDRLAILFPESATVDAHSALQSLRFEPDLQSLDIFTVELRGLVTAVFGAQTPDSHLFHYFLAAMPPRLAHAVVAGGCVTYQAAVERVRNILAADRLRRVPVSPSERVCAVDGASPDAGRVRAADSAPPDAGPPPALSQDGATGGGEEPGVRAVGGGNPGPQMLDLILRRIEQLELQVTGAQRVGLPGRGARMDDDVSKCLCCGQPGHSKPECRFRMTRCFRCGKVGHIQRTCFSGNAGGEGAQGGGRAPRMLGQGRREPGF